MDTLPLSTLSGTKIKVSIQREAEQTGGSERTGIRGQGSEVNVRGQGASLPVDEFTSLRGYEVTRLQVYEFTRRRLGLEKWALGFAYEYT